MTTRLTQVRQRLLADARDLTDDEARWVSRVRARLERMPSTVCLKPGAGGVLWVQDSTTGERVAVLFTPWPWGADGLRADGDVTGRHA